MPGLGPHLKQDYRIENAYHGINSPVHIVHTEVWSGTAAVVQHRAIRGLAEVGAVGGSHQHRGARGAGQQGDGAVVLVLEHRVLASHRAYPRVPVAAVF